MIMKTKSGNNLKNFRLIEPVKKSENFAHSNYVNFAELSQLNNYQTNFLKFHSSIFQWGDFNSVLIFFYVDLSLENTLSRALVG